MDLKFYLSLFLRRLHWFLLLLGLGTAVGVTLATVLPPVYSARATLLIESEQIPSDLASSTVQTGAGEALEIIRQRILTRDRLLEMVNRLDIYAAAEGRPSLSADQIVADLRERIRISGETTGGGPRGGSSATVVTVRFQAPTGPLAASVVNEVVALMQQENVAMRTATAGQTLEFFVQETERLDAELSRRSAEILAFQEQNLDALPDSLDFRRSQQAAAQERLQQLAREEATLADRRNRLVSLYETTGEVAAAPDVPQTPEERQLASLQDELSAALAVLSPQNPRVRLLQTQIDQLQARVVAQAGAAGPDNSGAPSAYEVQLADIDAQIEAIGEERGRIQSQMERLQASIEATPGNAIRLEQLQRDFAAVRTQYDQAVSSRARAETGDTIEALAKGQRMTVIEQAVPPGSPESPNRPLIAAAGAGAGLALGLGLVVLFEVLNAAVRRPADLVSKLGITPYGTLPYIPTRGEALRRRALLVLAFLAVLVVVPAGLWWVHTQVMPLDRLIERAIARLRPA